MTSNQIAAKAELEDERHNAAVEEETKRHNIAMEDLTDYQAKVQAEYNHNYLRLQEDINQNRLMYDYATLEEKEWYDQQYIDLQNQLKDLDDWYKHKMANLESDKAAELKSWHEASVSLGWYEAGIEEKKIEYQKHQWDEQNTIAWANYGKERAELLYRQTQQQADIAYNTGQLILAQQKVELAQKEYALKVQEYNLSEWSTKKDWSIKKQELELDKKMTKAKQFSAYTGGLGSLLHANTEGANSALRVLDSLHP